MDLKRTFTLILLLLLLKCLTGCVKTGGGINEMNEEDYQSVPSGVNPVEMQVWTPPSEEELALRRANQQELDTLTNEIETLLIGFDDLHLKSGNLGIAAQTFPPKVQEMDQEVSGKIEDLAKTGKERSDKVAAVKTSFDKTGKELHSLIEEEERRLFRPSDYEAAFVLFRNGKFQDAANRFQKLKQTRHPEGLRDNILFGLGASLYKLNKFQNASKHLESLVEGNSKNDKWHEGSLLLALLYSKSERKSRALYILETAMKENPPESVRPLMERLIHQIEKGNGLGSG